MFYLYNDLYLYLDSNSQSRLKFHSVGNVELTKEGIVKG